MQKRRNQKQLEAAISKARAPEGKALAYYNLGLFHDNNAREIEAIPNYEKAITLGLDHATKATALAWLASSLYKTDQPKKALRKVSEALSLTRDQGLTKFLRGLELRIKHYD